MPDEPTQPQATPVLSPAHQVAQDAKAKRIAEAKALADKRVALRLNIDKSFTDGEIKAKVISFEQDQNINAVVADAFLINMGNPNHFKYVHCDKFLSEFQPLKGEVS
jgi:hypothetical protein